MSTQVLRFRVQPDGSREGELRSFRVRIDVQLGPDNVPVGDRDFGYRGRVFALGTEVVIFEDWRSRLDEIRASLGSWLATRLCAKAWGIA